MLQLPKAGQDSMMPLKLPKLLHLRVAWPCILLEAMEVKQEQKQDNRLACR